MTGEELKNVRKKANLSQEEFGKKVGYSRSMISKLEKKDKVNSKKIEEWVSNYQSYRNDDAILDELNKTKDAIENVLKDDFQKISKTYLNIVKMKNLEKNTNFFQLFAEVDYTSKMLEMVCVLRDCEKADIEKNIKKLEEIVKKYRYKN